MKNVLATILVSMMAASAMASAQISGTDTASQSETSLYSIYSSGRYVSLESPGIMLPAGTKQIGGSRCVIVFNQEIAEDSILSPGRKIELIQLKGLYGNYSGASLMTNNDKTVKGIVLEGKTLGDLEKYCGLKATIKQRTDLQEASLQQ